MLSNWNTKRNVLLLYSSTIIKDNVTIFLADFDLYKKRIEKVLEYKKSIPDSFDNIKINKFVYISKLL